MKNAAEHLLEPLLCMFNALLARGDYPTVWCEGIISPLHKKGDTAVPDNYRKITVLCSVGKLFESILNGRLYFKNEATACDDPFQAGFMKDSRTLDNIFILYSLIMKQKVLKKPLFICFIDFTKAFDFVNRNALYHKLKLRGIKGNFLKLIQSMFSKATCRVKWRGIVSNQIDSIFGVLQGGMLSPKLFTEFLSDISIDLHCEYGVTLSDTLLYYLLYADDLVLFSDTAEGLQSQLDGIFKFCCKWHMILSYSKSKVMIYNVRNVDNYSFKFNNKTLDVVIEYKYLGVLFNSSVRNIFQKTYPMLAQQANKAIFASNKQVLNTIGKPVPKIAFKIFDSQILPILPSRQKLVVNML